MKLGLLGKSLTHSFSKDYFSEKFRKEGLKGFSYENFELQEIEELPELLKHEAELRGLNVTIPYKESVIPFLDELSAEAKEIGAVNTIAIEKSKLTGHNTDCYGFGESLKPLLRDGEYRALVLGTGGAAKAVKFVLRGMNMKYLEVSRNPSAEQVGYAEASEVLPNYKLVINTTPVGTFPFTDEMPPLKLDNLSENHLFYDLIYNPIETLLLQKAKEHGAQIKNGHEMLTLQAEKAWQIWQQQ